MIEGGFGIRMNAPSPSRLRAALTATLALLLRDRNVKKTGTVLYCKPLNTETFSVRVGRSTKSRLEKLAKSTGGSRAFLAAEAIVAYLDINEWQVAGVTKALSSLDRGKGVAHERVRDWVASWETRKERPVPKRV